MLDDRKQFEHNQFILLYNLCKILFFKFKSGSPANLIDKGTDEDALDRAINNGDLKAIELLLDGGLNIEANYYGKNLLMNAAILDKGEVIKCLLDRGAKIEAKDDNGNTALMLAAYNGKVDAIKILLDRGADIDAMNNVGETALARALSANQEEAVHLLLDRAAPISTFTSAASSSVAGAGAAKGQFDFVR